MTDQMNRPNPESDPYRGVPEGDLPAGSRPTPGASPTRRAWTGRQHEGRPVTLDRDHDAAGEFGAERQMSGRRIIAIDVARGLALVGMIAVHTLPSWNGEAERSTLTWWLAAGNAAALFALLAGVGLALLTGGRGPVARQRLWRYRTRLFVRAALIFLIGVAANHLLDPPVYNILPYYGLLFLLAIPFLWVRKRFLVGWAAALVVLAPLLQYVVRGAQRGEGIPGPQLTDLTGDPAGLLSTLLFTGSYPVTTWFVYVLVGLVVGRLALDRMAVQISLLGYGTLLALLGQGLSYLSVWFLGGWERMLYSEEDVTVTDVSRAIYRGTADADLPTSSLAWLTVASPHSNTPFALLHTTGIALAVLGAALLLCRVIPTVLKPLAKLGAMTLTMYLGHLAFLSLGFFDQAPWFWFVVQLLTGLAFAAAWLLVFRQGPLELLVAQLSDLPVRLAPNPEPLSYRQQRGRRRGTRSTPPVPPREDGDRAAEPGRGQL